MKHNLKVFVTYGILFELMTNLYKPFSAKFLSRIGGSDFHITLLNSIPCAAMLLSVIVGSTLINKVQNQKYLTRKLILVSRFVILLFATVPLIKGELAPIYYLFLNALFYVPFGMYQVAYQSYIGLVFTKDQRAEAISKRNKYSIIAIMTVTLATGQILARLPQTELERLHLYQFFFVSSFVLGIAEYIIFERFQNKSEHEPSQISIISVLSKAVHIKSFRNHAISSFLFYLGWAMGWPLFSIYTIKNLGADESWLSIISIGSFIVMYFGYGFWGEKIKRWGNDRVLWMVTMGMSLTPIMYILSRNLTTLAIFAASSGFFISGTTTVLMNKLLEVAPEENRPIYVGIFNAFIYVAQAVAPMIGLAFMTSKDIVFALFVTAGLRAIGSLSFLIRGKKATPKESIGFL